VALYRPMMAPHLAPVAEPGRAIFQPIQQSMDSKIEQLRQAQEAGQLDPVWDPLDVLVLVNRITMSRAA